MSSLNHCRFLCLVTCTVCDKTCVFILVGLVVISAVQYVVMICACGHCRMKFAVAVVCLLMLIVLGNLRHNNNSQ